MNTYVFITEYLNEKIVDDMFKKRGNWKKILYKDIKNNKKKLYNNNKNDIIDYVYMDGLNAYRYKNLWTMDKKMFNMINFEKYQSVIDKFKLYLFMKKNYEDIYKKYMIEQYEFDIYDIYPFKYKNLFENGKLWILKIVEGGSGKHIYVIHNYIEFVKKIKDLQKLDDNTIKKYPTFVLSEYINNPLTFNNKKFHIRMYYMFNPSNQKGYLHKYGCIYTAEKDYVQKNYNNKKIHDTHFGSTPADYYFPHEFINLYSKDVILDIYEQLKEIFHYIKLLSKGECYPESNKCYQIYGADIMITDDFRVKLIEINSRIGIATYDNKLLTGYLMEGILETIIDPIFPPKNKQSKKNYFIEV